MRYLKLWLCGLPLALSLLGIPAIAETFVVGFQPYDVISYQAIINAELGLWKKYVPKGTVIDFQPASQGTVIASNMLGGRAHIGYVSGTPAVIMSTRTAQAKIHMVASLGLSESQASLLLVRKEAPEFQNPEEIARWLDGKVIAAARGTASDQFLRRFFSQYAVNPGEYLNQSVDVIASNFRNGKLDAISVWNPWASRLSESAGEGAGRVVANGRACENMDLGVLVMRGDFMKTYPDVAKGYLRAELEAQRYLLDPANRERVVEMISGYAIGMPKKIIWNSIYGQLPAEKVDEVRIWMNFSLSKREKQAIADGVAFLVKEELIAKDAFPEDAIHNTFALEVFKESKIKRFSPEAALGVIKVQSISECPFE